MAKYYQETGFRDDDDDTDFWSSVFLHWCCLQSGLEASSQKPSRSWLEVGREKEFPEPGDVVVMWRDNRRSERGHVGLFLGYSGTGKMVYVLGAHHRGSISVASFFSNRVLGFRELMPSDKWNIPEATPQIKMFSFGKEVGHLQYLLGKLGYKAGAVDGVFGPKTERALLRLQNSNDIEPDGIYGEQTRSLMLAMIKNIKVS